MTRAFFLLSAVLFWASTTFANSGSLEEYGVGNKAQLTTNTTYRFMTWNIYKGGIDGLYTDYGYFVDTVDFIATQEFLLNSDQEELISNKQNYHWAFAKSFESGDGWTLMTKSGIFTAQYEHTLVITKGKPLIMTLPA